MQVQTYFLAVKFEILLLSSRKYYLICGLGLPNQNKRKFSISILGEHNIKLAID